MNAKSINWGKWMAICTVAAVVGSFSLWAFDKATTYAALPSLVSDHERRIAALEAQNATNSIALQDRFRDIDRDLQELSRRVERLSGIYDYNATNRTVARQ